MSGMSKISRDHLQKIGAVQIFTNALKYYVHDMVMVGDDVGSVVGGGDDDGMGVGDFFGLRNSNTWGSGA